MNECCMLILTKHWVHKIPTNKRGQNPVYSENARSAGQSVLDNPNAVFGEIHDHSRRPSQSGINSTREEFSSVDENVAVGFSFAADGNAQPCD
jgi:hypothetical protein